MCIWWTRLGCSISIVLVLYSSPAYSQTNSKTLYNFGDWRIERVDSNRSFLLIGVGEVKGDTTNFLGFRYFWIQCYEESNAISISIPFDRKPEVRTPIKTWMVSTWSDRGAPVDLTFFALNELLLSAMTGNNKELDFAVRTIVSQLEQAKERFSFSVGAKSVHFDVSDFRPAWTRSTICANANNAPILGVCECMELSRLRRMQRRKRYNR